MNLNLRISLGFFVAAASVMAQNDLPPRPRVEAAIPVAEPAAPAPTPKASGYPAPVLPVSHPSDDETTATTVVQDDKPTAQKANGKEPEWERNILSVTILDDGRPVALPVEGKEAIGRTSVGSLPKAVSPYPPKALSPIPEGWRLATDPAVSARAHKVTLKNGRTVNIDVYPPALFPASPDATTFVLPREGGHLLEAIAEARKAQSASRAKIEALLETLNRQLPVPGPEPAPIP